MSTKVVEVQEEEFHNALEASEGVGVPIDLGACQIHDLPSCILIETACGRYAKVTVC